MEFFKKKPKNQAPISLEKSADQLINFFDLAGERGLVDRIEQRFQKSIIDSANYYNAYDSGDSSGNYFGEEFNIRATAGRIKQAYSKEPWMYACATLIAKSLSLVPFKVVDVKSGDEVKDHPMAKKIISANKYSDHLSMKWCGYLDLVLGGNYFHIFDEAFNTAMIAPVENVTLEVDPKTREIINILLWDQNSVGSTAKRINYKQVVHMKMPNPFNPLYGLSLFIAASRPMILDRAMNEFHMAFYLRGASNSGVIEMTEDVSNTRLERFMRSFESSFSGKTNWWRQLILPKGAKWVSSGLSIAEMQHLEALKENRLTFLAAVGVPPSKVGIVQDVNRSTSEVQDETFWENTIKPLANFVAASWTNCYLNRVIYSGQVRIEPDFSGIEALNGSILSKGEQAKAVESYLTLNEIREDILGYPPLVDERGGKLISEIRASSQPQAPFNFSLEKPESIIDEPQSFTPVMVSEVDDQSKALFITRKSAAIEAQNRVERKLTDKFKAGHRKYIDQFVNVATDALLSNRDLKKSLDDHKKHFAKVYITEVETSLTSAFDKGFITAQAHVKDFRAKRKDYRFRDIDREAIDTLRERDKSGRRETLIKRGLKNFVGMNQTNTDRVLKILEDGIQDGLSTDQIARAIRDTYDEKYYNQSATIARTELLTAVSDGMKFSHDVLGKVFTKTKKEWFHVAEDEGSREDHLAYEALGVVDSDYKYGGVLEYPRDPNGEGKDNINCFLPNTDVKSLGTKKVFQRIYNGPIVTLKFISGDKLTATPNHPILTSEGFIPISKITKGSKVFKCNGIDYSRSINRNIEYIHSSFDKLFSSFQSSRAVKRISGTVLDFHGDGSAFDINIKSIERTLHSGVKPTRFEKSIGLSLQNSNLTMADGFSDGRQAQSSGRVGFSHSLVSGSNLLKPSVFIESGPLEKLGLASTSRGDTSNSLHSFDHGTSWDAKHPLDLKHGNFLVEVQMDDVIDIEMSSYSGHVYNLQSDGEWYIADNFIAHNCRCSFSTVIPDDAESNAEIILEND